MIHTESVKMWEAETAAMRAEIKRLQTENHKLREALADKARRTLELMTALQRIDGINDNPAHFNAEIDAVLTATMKHKP